MQKPMFVLTGVFLIFLALLMPPTVKFQSIEVSVNATSGSPEDLQTAIDEVAMQGGGTVYIPEGTFTFNPSSDKSGVDGNPTGVNIPGGVNVVGAGIGKTVLQETVTPPYKASMFSVDGSNGKAVRISGISFRGYVEDESKSIVGILIHNTVDFRIDHCEFEDFSSFSIFSKKTSGKAHKGVIDHCIIDNPYKEQSGSWEWAYGIGVIGDGVTWEPLDSILGKYEDNVVYIEDCTFSRCRYAVASNTGGWYVFRHNIVYISPNYGSFGKAGIDVHEGDPAYIGGRGLEAYNNTFYGTDNGQQAFKIRCGSGVVYENVIKNIYTGVWLLKADWASDEQHYVKNLYIWGNSFINVNVQYSIDGSYQEGVDYYLNEFSYTPYPYPHPLVSEEELPPPPPEQPPPPTQNQTQQNQTQPQQNGNQSYPILSVIQQNIFRITLMMSGIVLVYFGIKERKRHEK